MDEQREEGTAKGSEKKRDDTFSFWSWILSLQLKECVTSTLNPLFASSSSNFSNTRMESRISVESLWRRHLLLDYFGSNNLKEMWSDSFFVVVLFLYFFLLNCKVWTTITWMEGCKKKIAFRSRCSNAFLNRNLNSESEGNEMYLLYSILMLHQRMASPFQYCFLFLSFHVSLTIKFFSCRVASSVIQPLHSLNVAFFLCLKIHLLWTWNVNISSVVESFLNFQCKRISSQKT